MEINQVIPLVTTLILVGLLLGVGILAYDNLGISARDIYTKSEKCNTTGGDCVLSVHPILSVERFSNGTDKVNTSFNRVGAEVNWTAAGLVDVDNETFKPKYSWYMNYTYAKNSTATETMNDMTSSISPIASTWMALIVTVAILAIVLGLVITAFQNRR